MSETSMRSKQDIEKQFEDLTPEQAIARITSSPAQAVYEGRWALQQLNEMISQQGDADNVRDALEIVASLARCVGQAEALAFAFSAHVSHAEPFPTMRTGNGARGGGVNS